MEIKTKYNIGDSVFSIYQKKTYKVKSTCYLCKGRGHFFIEDIRRYVNCPQCNGFGKTDSKQPMWLVHNPVKTEKDTKNGRLDAKIEEIDTICDGENVTILYKLEYLDEMVSEADCFDTIEEAVEESAKRNQEITEALDEFNIDKSDPIRTGLEEKSKDVILGKIMEREKMTYQEMKALDDKNKKFTPPPKDI